MPDLLLPSLEIQNFRAFEHLRIERLGRVNLITGKNNVGKTSMLEALYLYARGASPYQLLELLDMRDELPKQARTQSNLKVSEDEDMIQNFKYLFHGRTPIHQAPDSIVIGPAGTNKNTLELNLSMRKIPLFHETLVDQPYGEPITDIEEENDSEELDSGSVAPFCTVKTRAGGVYRYWLDRILDKNYNIHLYSSDSIISPYIRAEGWLPSAISQQWDKVALTPQEDDVLNALRIITPNLQRIGFVGEENGIKRRLAIVRINGMQEPVPLRSMGEGLNRLFGLALALTTARDGILLVDEIETGLHYSVMRDVWKLIFQVAQRLNVQVFATTHSWDCIGAFEQAAEEDNNEEALLIRLRERDGEIIPTVFGERELAIVTRDLIEVR